MAIEILHQNVLPKGMTSPPYGATIIVHEDHTTVDLPYVQGGPIIVLHGEIVKIGLQFNEQQNIVLCVTREKIPPDAPPT